MFQHVKQGLGMTDACKSVMPTCIILITNCIQEIFRITQFNILSHSCVCTCHPLAQEDSAKAKCHRSTTNVVVCEKIPILA